MNTFNNWREFLDELPNDIADIIMDKVFEDQRPNITENVIRYFEALDGHLYQSLSLNSQNFFDRIAFMDSEKDNIMYYCYDVIDTNTNNKFRYDFDEGEIQIEDDDEYYDYHPLPFRWDINWMNAVEGGEEDLIEYIKSNLRGFYGEEKGKYKEDEFDYFCS